MAPFIFDDDRQSMRLNSADAPDSPESAPAGDAPQQETPASATALPSSQPQPPAAQPPSLAAETARDRAEDISIALEWKLLYPLLLRGHPDPRPEDPRPIAFEPCITSSSSESTSTASPSASSPTISSSSAPDEASINHDHDHDQDSHERARLEQVHTHVASTILSIPDEHAVTLHALRREGGEEKDVWATSWVVKRANSAEPLEQEGKVPGYVWVPVEVCSPRMRFGEARTRARMRDVLGALQAGHRLVANASCEVHVHLGRMDGRAWGLGTLKRLASVLWLAEPTLRRIRDPRSPNFGNVYTWGFAMREQSRLAMLVGKDAAAMCATLEEASMAITDDQIAEAVRAQPAAAPKEVAALAAIWRTTSHLELGRLLSGPEKKYRRLGFNFSAFGEEDERARRNPRTMEFRIMDGSVDTELIVSWLAICGTIVETAVAEGDPRFGAALSLLLGRTAERTPPGDTEAETVGVRLGREFAELMQALEIGEEHYRGFQDKIRREH
ncbi:hypothetical protein VTJ49DRAFT_5904 [Mycothermus thermophilus]|uniref:Amidoligase enzyme-domain-containing protein n=1 Tax=Humicola insolens TaxID=85995 RepID=A0ABR3V2A6_HUMIN